MHFSSSKKKQRIDENILSCLKGDVTTQGYTLATTHKERKMSSTLKVSDLEVKLAKVKPNQDPFEVAFIDHNDIELRMKGQRRGVLRNWWKAEEDMIGDNRRSYLDVQKNHFMMGDRLFVKHDNVMMTKKAVCQNYGEATANIFEKEKNEYNEVMRLHEKRFDFRAKQDTYINVRRNLMSVTYDILDQNMKQVNSEWMSYSEMYAAHDGLVRQVESLKSQVSSLEDSNKKMRKAYLDEVNRNDGVFEVTSLDDEVVEQPDKKKQKTEE